jgi:hypothetical protein
MEMSNRIEIDLFHERSQHGYHTGDLEVSSPRNPTRAAGSITITEWSYDSGRVEISVWGVMKGWLAKLRFNNVETLDKLCAKWLVERGHLKYEDRWGPEHVLSTWLKGLLRREV